MNEPTIERMIAAKTGRIFFIGVSFEIASNLICDDCWRSRAPRAPGKITRLRASRTMFGFDGLSHPRRPVHEQGLLQNERPQARIPLDECRIQSAVHA